MQAGGGHPDASSHVVNIPSVGNAIRRQMRRRIFMMTDQDVLDEQKPRDRQADCACSLSCLKAEKWTKAHSPKQRFGQTVSDCFSRTRSNYKGLRINREGGARFRNQIKRPAKRPQAPTTFELQTCPSANKLATLAGIGGALPAKCFQTGKFVQQASLIKSSLDDQQAGSADKKAGEKAVRADILIETIEATSSQWPINGRSTADQSATKKKTHKC